MKLLYMPNFMIVDVLVGVSCMSSTGKEGEEHGTTFIYITFTCMLQDNLER